MSVCYDCGRVVPETATFGDSDLPDELCGPCYVEQCEMLLSEVVKQHPSWRPLVTALAIDLAALAGYECFNPAEPPPDPWPAERWEHRSLTVAVPDQEARRALEVKRDWLHVSSEMAATDRVRMTFVRERRV